MHATIRTYAGTDIADALAPRADEVIRDVIGDIPGFRGYYLIRTDDGNTVTISLFDDEAGADASNSAAAAWVGENLADLHIPAPDIKDGKVIFST